MRLLLDTHALLWFGLEDPQLSADALALLEDESNSLELSPASYWEIAIKIGLGRYRLSEPYEAFFQEVISTYGIRVLPIELSHTSVLTSLPLHHRDPFDRLLVAQAIVEGIAVVSCDTVFDRYPITRYW